MRNEMILVAGVVAMLLMTGVAWAVAETAAAPAVEEQVLLADTFDNYEDAEVWEGGGAWKPKVNPACDLKFAIGKDYGREGKGLLFKHKRTSEEHKCKSGDLVCDLAILKGHPRFSVSLSYFTPPGAEHRGRVDLNIDEAGRGSMGFVMLSQQGITFIRKWDKKKNEYANLHFKPGQWHTVKIEVDQPNLKFRVTVDGSVVKGDWGEWAEFRAGAEFSADKPKSMRLHTAHNWPDSTRYFDDLKVCVPKEK